jgi:hypothetical protein
LVSVFKKQKISNYRIEPEGVRLFRAAALQNLWQQGARAVNDGDTACSIVVFEALMA